MTRYTDRQVSKVRITMTAYDAWGYPIGRVEQESHPDDLRSHIVFPEYLWKWVMGLYLKIMSPEEPELIKLHKEIIHEISISEQLEEMGGNVDKLIDSISKELEINSLS